MLVNAPPIVQTVLTACGALLLVLLGVLVMLPRYGRVLVASARGDLDKDPADKEALARLARGKRWLRLGSDLRALRDSPTGQMLPPAFRAVLDSLPESDPPPASIAVTTKTTVKVDADKTPVGPRRIPPLPCLLLMVVAFVLGCTDLRPAVSTLNGARTAGHAYADVVERECTVPLERAAEMEEAAAAAEVARLKAMGCPAALMAQTDLAEAHRAMHDLVVAIEAGQCVATIARDVRETCDLTRAAAELADAGARLGAAVERLERGAR